MNETDSSEEEKWGRALGGSLSILASAKRLFSDDSVFITTIQDSRRWVRPKNLYGKGGMVEANGRYHSGGCACAAHESATS
jgi:hypothetical protein